MLPAAHDIWCQCSTSTCRCCRVVTCRGWRRAVPTNRNLCFRNSSLRMSAVYATFITRHSTPGGVLCATIDMWQVVNESATGSTKSRRVRLSLTIAVERVDFDSNSCLLRLSGRNSEENPHVKVISDTHAVHAIKTVSTADGLWMTKHHPRSRRDAQHDKPNKRSRVSTAYRSRIMSHSVSGGTLRSSIRYAIG